MDDKAKREVLLRKDGGWAWMVAFGTFIVLFVVMAYVRNAGIFFVAIQSRTGDSAEDVAWVSTSFNICLQLLTPLSSVLCAKFGTRPIVMLGGFLMSAGLALSVLSESLTLYILTLGVLEGIGAALCLVPSMIIIGFHFERRIGLANSLAFTGSSIGHMVLAPVVTYIMEKYSLNGALLIMSAITLHIVLAGALYRPIAYDDTNDLLQTDSPSQLDLHKSWTSINTTLKTQPSQLSVFRQLLNRPSFYSLCISNSCSSFVFSTVYKYIPALGQDINVSPDVVAFMFAVGSGVDLGSRVLTGLVTDTNVVTKYIKRYRITGLSVLLMGVNAFVLSRNTAESVFCTGIILHSLAGGTFYCTTTITSLDLLGKDLFSLGHSVAAMVGIVIAPMDSMVLGKLRDTTGNFTVTYGIIGTIGVTAASALFCQQFLVKLRCVKENVESSGAAEPLKSDQV